MLGTKFLDSVRLEGLLSYGSRGTELDLLPLNVLIGPNAGGKSNLIEALGLLAAAPRDLAARIREGGGASEWIWKGGRLIRTTAKVEAVLHHPNLHYRLAFTAEASRFHLRRETLENHVGPVGQVPYYDFSRARAAILARESGGRRIPRSLPIKELDLEQSILSQRKDPDRYPELTGIGAQFGRMRFYQEFDLSTLRQPQKIDLPNDFLLPDGSNLGLVLNDLQSRLQVKRSILERLKVFYERVEDVNVKIQGGTVQVFFLEEGLRNPVPATRLSDGTLRYLCLLTILCHPEPPPLVCIEEPELGLHPDAISTVADLLIDASARTQLVVTTHSDALVSALSETPEAIVVCEREDNGTTLRRLEPARLAEWLERYRLGELWRMGEIGGTRW